MTRQNFKNRRFRVVWALVLSGLLTGCAMDAGTQDNQNHNNTNSNDSCHYSLAVTPPSPVIGAEVSIRVENTGACAPTGYAWAMSDPNNIPVALAVRPDGRQADFVPEVAGSHPVNVAVSDSLRGTVNLYQNVLVVDPAGQEQTFLLRFSPPSSANVPRQQEAVTIIGHTPLSGQVYSLDPGFSVQNTIEGPSGPVAAYLRLVQRGFPLYREVDVPASGHFTVRLLQDKIYDVLVIPEDPSPAPVLLEALDVSQLGQSATFDLDAGVQVLGYVLDGAGDPVAGAQAALRTGNLPSGVGTADFFDGRFVLMARPGDHSLEISPPDDTPLPRVVISEGQGLDVQSGDALTLSFQYANWEVRQTSLRVVAGPPGSEQPVEDARVTLESTDLAAVGTLTVTRDASVLGQVDATGMYRVTVTTDAQGETGLLDVPAGVYRLVIEPPAGEIDGRVTTVLQSFDLTGGDLLNQQLALQPPAVIQGVVLDPDQGGAEGIEVLAVTGLGVGSAVEATTDATGFFSLPVIQGATYQVSFLPDPALGLARRVIPGVAAQGEVTTLIGDGPQGQVLLPVALTVSGEVLLQGSSLPGVLVQAIPSGVVGDPVLAEAVSDGDGQFTLLIPDPGVAE